MANADPYYREKDEKLLSGLKIYRLADRLWNEIIKKRTTKTKRRRKGER